MQVKKQQLEPDMEIWTGSKLGKEYVKAVYCHPACLTYMQSIQCESLAGWITSWNQDCWKKYQQPQICRWYHSNGRKWRRTKEPLDEGERVEWKCWLKTQHSKNKDHGIQFHHIKANRRGEKWKHWHILLSWAPKSLWMVTAVMKLKDAWSLEEKLWAS